MMAMEILAKRALNLAALFLVLIVCPESIRAQPVVTAGSRLSDTFAASTPVMNTAREAATATLLRNGKVLIAGGSDGSISLSCTELYDPTTNTFANSTPLMNVARDNATATLLRDGKVLIAGGGGVSASLSSAELYDPATNTFAPSASTPVMNTARYFATATLLSKGKVLIAGGINGGTSLRSTELYNWATNTFTASTSTPVMNTARDLATATALRNGKVLIAGGESFMGAPPGTTILSSTELYSPGRPR
jgi:hypothetical protein